MEKTFMTWFCSCEPFHTKTGFFSKQKFNHAAYDLFLKWPHRPKLEEMPPEVWRASHGKASSEGADGSHSPIPHS